jgi:hypothetical protein
MTLRGRAAAGLATSPAGTLDGMRRDPPQLSLCRALRAFGFMTAVALGASGPTIHPEMVECLERVPTVVLTTHSAGGLTGLDIALAKRADALALKLARD